tara:strand:+ start:335 stop:457 length:123 start_codon:yes stop_codon:yes gene_type:complete
MEEQVIQIVQQPEVEVEGVELPLLELLLEQVLFQLLVLLL